MPTRSESTDLLERPGVTPLNSRHITDSKLGRGALSVSDACHGCPGDCDSSLVTAFLDVVLARLEQSTS